MTVSELMNTLHAIVAADPQMANAVVLAFGEGNLNPVIAVRENDEPENEFIAFEYDE